MKDISGVILSGGQGRRMGGRDKGLIEVAGRPLVSYVIERLRRQVDEIIISANRNLDRYRAFGFTVVPDVIGTSWGPLAGIYSAAQLSSTPYLLIVPCDCPLLPTDLAARLRAARERAAVPVAIAHDGARLQNTFCLIAAALKDDLAAFLEAGGRKTEQWLTGHPHVTVDFSDRSEAFLNVNSDESVPALAAKLA